MKSSIISDTSSLIILTKLDRLALLETLFDHIIIPKRVERELQAKEDGVHQQIINNALFEVVECKDTRLLNLLDDILDDGEAEALVLAKERQMILLIDEKKGRKTAKDMGIRIIGFLGVLILNYRQNRLDVNEIEDILLQADKLNFRLSKKLKQDFLNKINKA